MMQFVNKKTFNSLISGGKNFLKKKKKEKKKKKKKKKTKNICTARK